MAREVRTAVWLWAALFLPVSLAAHEPGLSMLQVRTTPTGLELTAGLNPMDAQRLLATGAGVAGKNAATDPASLQTELAAKAPELWTVAAGGVTLTPQETHVEVRSGDNVSVMMLFARPAGTDTLKFRAVALAGLPPAHREFALITDENGHAFATKMLSGADDTVETSPAASEPAGQAGGMKADEAAAATPTFGAFVRLGIEHIWTGYDHLLFLFALLIVCGNYRSIVAIITCFTAAHSLTLALATLQLVSLPARLTEAAIAASIVFVGAENLWRRGHEPQGRRVLTFAFGLIHGFGFASVLHDLGVGAGGQGVALPLFAFNFGVELGQIAIASAVLPLVWWLRKHETFVRRGVPAVSAMVTLAGLYWLAQRALFT